MYAKFFGLKQEPFSIAPDPRYLFMSERHREALAHLLYGVRGGGGFVLLSGEIGAGKTTVCRCFLEQIPKRCNVGYIFNPKQTVDELLQSVCDEFGIPAPHSGPGVATVKDYVDALNEFLLKTHAVGQNNVLIIDEAQNLSADVLEQLRLLTNLETNERKLLQIVLIGQPELRTMLARPELEQLAQRVIARFHLEALSETETSQYIRHRLAVAGMGKSSPFDGKAMRRIHELSRGVPRRINLLCDRALLGAYSAGRSSVDREIVDKAAGEVFGKPQAVGGRRSAYRREAVLGLGLVLGATLFGVVSWATGDPDRKPTRVAALSPIGSAASMPSAAPASAAAASAPLPAAYDLKTNFASLASDEQQAWRALAPSWDLALGDGDPCRAAQQQRVHCFRHSGSSLALVRQLGRPGILTLYDDARGRAGFAVLTGLTDDSATLRIGERSQTVPLASLAGMWHGEFATFWRTPPGYGGSIASAGPAADWLAAQLAAVQGDSPPGDAPLKSRVHAFQVAQGLTPDGLAGPITLMQINRAAGVDEPRLLGER